MPIFSDEKLDAILNEGITDRIAENEKKIKDAKYKIVDNFKNNTSKKKRVMKLKLKEDGDLINYTATDEIESLEESKTKFYQDIDGRIYRPIKSSEGYKVDDPQKYNVRSINGKPYISDGLSLSDSDPEQKIGKIAGTIVGWTAGAGLLRIPVAILGNKVGREIEYSHKVNKYNKTDLFSNIKKIRSRKEGYDYDEYNYDEDYIEEATVDGKKYRAVTKADEKNPNIDLKDSIIINGKKYIYDSTAQAKYNKDHPIEYTGRQIGSAIGTAGGAAIGGAAGAVAGSAIGAGLGGVAGAVAGSTGVGNAVGNTIKKVADIPSKIKNKIKKEDFDFRNVYRSKEFSIAMEQYFDTDDNDTRRILLAVNEDDQNKVLVGLTSKLYENIIDKVDDIDFGEIPMTKGDITKLSNFKNILECTETMTKLLVEFKQDTKPIDIIRTAIDNIMNSVNIWRRAFTGNIELPMVVYNTTVLTIIESITYMISMCVEYIKVPSSDSFQITIDKSALSKTKNHMLFENLERFNDSYRKGQITNAMEYVIKENVKNFAGTTIGAGAALVGITGLLFCIIPIIRELIFLFYYNRVRLSEFFDTQADMLQINAYNVENNRIDLSKEDKKSISNKQIKIAERFRKFANKIGIDLKESESKATKEMTKENKKYKVDEVIDEIPDSAGSALF